MWRWCRPVARWVAGSARVVVVCLSGRGLGPLLCQPVVPRSVGLTMLATKRLLNREPVWRRTVVPQSAGLMKVGVRWLSLTEEPVVASRR